jgi:hypothetical protein
MTDAEKKTYIEDEVFLVLHSGEIPEISLHSSLYYLTGDPEGPRLELNGEEILPLKEAVVKRYRLIILRDLDPLNRDKRIYRGMARCAANWQRLRKYCSRESLDYTALQCETATALQNFLRREVFDVGSGKRTSSINCSQAEIASLAVSLGIPPADLPDGWQKLCPGEE